jgi:hypothetical protein
MLNSYRLVQARVTSILLEATLKEYAADWLKNADSVVRDETGKFAKKAASAGQEVSQVKQKVSSELLKLTARGLDKLVEKNPKFTDELLDKMFGLDAQKARDKLADMYGEINPELPNAIRPDPLKETLADVLKKALAHKGNPKQLAKDLAQAFELVGDSYNKLIDDLNNVESESEAIKLLGKIAATSIPIAGYLAATLTPEIAIGLLAGDTLGTILASTAAAQATSFAANKAMDKMDVTDPKTRLAVDLFSSVAAGTAISAGAKVLVKKGILKANVAEKSAAVTQKNAKKLNEFVPRSTKLPSGVEKRERTSETVYEFLVNDQKVKLLFKDVFEDSGAVSRETIFKVNNSLDKNPFMEGGVGGKIAVKLVKIFGHEVSSLPEGTILRCTAHEADGNGAFREAAYQKFGFSKPQRNHDGAMFAIIEGGAVKPYKP